jgi:transposase-like protein
MRFPKRGTFEPQLLAKYQRRFPGFDDKIVLHFDGLMVP